MNYIWHSIIQFIQPCWAVKNFDGAWLKYYVPPIALQLCILGCLWLVLMDWMLTWLTADGQSHSLVMTAKWLSRCMPWGVVVGQFILWFMLRDHQVKTHNCSPQCVVLLSSSWLYEYIFSLNICDGNMTIYKCHMNIILSVYMYRKRNDCLKCNWSPVSFIW